MESQSNIIGENDLSKLTTCIKDRAAAEASIEDYYGHLVETIEVDATDRAADLDATASSPRACHNRQPHTVKLDVLSRIFVDSISVSSVDFLTPKICQVGPCIKPLCRVHVRINMHSVEVDVLSRFFVDSMSVSNVDFLTQKLLSRNLCQGFMQSPCPCQHAYCRVGCFTLYQAIMQSPCPYQHVFYLHSVEVDVLSRFFC